MNDKQLGKFMPADDGRIQKYMYIGYFFLTHPVQYSVPLQVRHSVVVQ